MAPKLTPPSVEAPKPTKLRQGFITLAEALLKSLAEVFPECDAVDTGLHLFTSLVKGDAAREEQFIRQCNSVFQKHAAELKTREVEALFAAAEEMPVLKEVNFRDKWNDPGFDESSKENLWQYLTSLKLYAELFCAVPSGVMGKIESVATDLGARLQNGELNLAQMDIAGIGNELLGQLTKEEMTNFESNLPNIYASISEMAGSIASQVGQPGLNIEELMKSVVSNQQPGGSVDISAIMQRIGSLADPGAGGVINPAQLMGLAQNIGPLLSQLQGGATGGSFDPADFSNALKALQGARAVEDALPAPVKEKKQKRIKK